MDKIKIIVVDDSAFMRKAISDMIESENNFEVVAKFRDGRELVEKVDKYNPDHYHTRRTYERFRWTCNS